MKEDNINYVRHKYIKGSYETYFNRRIIDLKRFLPFLLLTKFNPFKKRECLILMQKCSLHFHKY